MTAIPLQEGLDPIAHLLSEYVGLAAGPAETIGGLVRFVVVFVAIVLAGRLFALPFLRRILDRRGLDEHARKPITKLAGFLLLFGAVAVAFGVGGFSSFLSSLAVVAAAGTIAIGFALQDVLKNFVSGVFIFVEQPFRIGDWVEWDGNSGVVEDISLRVTRVRTFDNELLTVPNYQLTDNVVKNPVAKDQLRVKVTFGVGYDDDIDAATDVILEEADAHPDILDDPAPSVRVEALGDSAVDLQTRIWIDDPSRSDFVRTRGELTQSVKERFDEQGIDIPYPTRSLTGGIDVSDAVATGEVGDGRATTDGGED